ncbi:MAG: hypothetical protein WBA14_02360, partial [Pseudolabrys sp.]
HWVVVGVVSLGVNSGDSMVAEAENSGHRLVRCTCLLLTQADSLHPAMLSSTLITDHLKNIGKNHI